MVAARALVGPRDDERCTCAHLLLVPREHLAPMHDLEVRHVRRRPVVPEGQSGGCAEPRDRALDDGDTGRIMCGINAVVDHVRMGDAVSADARRPADDTQVTSECIGRARQGVVRPDSRRGSGRSADTEQRRRGHARTGDGGRNGSG
jgi:hypothetical protein